MNCKIGQQLGNLKKMFWFSDNGFKKKGKAGMVFIFYFYFQSNMGRVFIFCFYFQRVKNITQTSSILLSWQTNNTIVFTRRELDFPTDTSYFRSKLMKGLLFSPTSFMSVKSPMNILLHNSATVVVLSTGRKVHGTICLERNCTLKLTRTVFLLVAMLNFYFRFRLISHSNVCQNSSASPACLTT